MSVPNTVFIDTGIFDEQNYNFESASFVPFIAAVKDKKLEYILPIPTSLEINRHIAERADAVVKALEEAKRKAPFLAKLKEWPTPDFSLSWEIHRVARNEWRQFLNNFRVLRLTFDDVDLMEVMDWYDKQQPPFSVKKKKEFPDALALNTLLQYSRKEQVPIAVVAKDGDFKEACTRFSHLFYFPSLPAFTESLLLNDQRVDKIKSLIEADAGVIEREIKERFPSLHFYPSANPDGTVEAVQVHDVQTKELHIVGLGNSECTIAFEVNVEYSADVGYDDLESSAIESPDVFIPYYRYSGIVGTEARVAGVAKIELDSNWEVFGDVTSFRFQETEVEIYEVPERQIIA